MLGVISYNEQGFPTCEICGLSFKKLCSHTRQAHNVSALEYKKMFGLNIGKGIMCEDSIALAKKKVYENYDLCIMSNLIQGGDSTRFKIGSEGRLRDKLSEQERLRLSNNRLPKGE